MDKEKRTNTVVYFGIFFMSMAIIMLEISLTRVFSISLWYHFAFLVVSMALLGYGISGVFISFFPSLLKKDLLKLLAAFAFIFAAAMPVCFYIMTQIPLDPYKITKLRHFGFMLFYYLIFPIQDYQSVPRLNPFADVIYQR